MVSDAIDLPPMAGPVVSRPSMPQGYGLPQDDRGLLSWAQVQERLEPALHYWLATTRPDGRPHLVPRWGVWVDGRFWYDGAPSTVHARNLERNAHVALSLEDGRQAVMLQGTSLAVRVAAQPLGAQIAAAFGKYHALDYAPTADAWSGPDGGGMRVITPSSARAWFDFPADCTRFTW